MTEQPISSTSRPPRPISETFNRPPMSMVIDSLMELETPHAVVDCTRMSANIARVAEYARSHRLHLRPHVKTHKDHIVASLQLKAGALGVTTATAREAQIMAEVATDILVAYPPVDPRRIERLINLPASVNLTIALDSIEAIARLSDALKQRAETAEQERTVGVVIELDLGGRRTGVSNEEQLLELASYAAQSFGTRFAGLMVHPGNIRHKACDPSQTRQVDAAASSSIASSIKDISTRLREYIQALKKKGLECEIVSGGNTPSLFYSHLIPELTEIRPGTYVYCDRDIAAQGVFEWQDCAYTILATVVSTAVPGQAVIDAGTKAIAKEPLPGLDGFGALFDRPEVIIKSMSEEHGILDLSRSDWKPQVGDRVRVVPNHVCVSVHLQDRVAFVESGALILRDVAARGR